MSNSVHHHPSVLVPGTNDDDLDHLFQEVMIGFLPSPISTDSMTFPAISNGIPLTQDSANRMFLLSYPIHQLSRSHKSHRNYHQMTVHLLLFVVDAFPQRRRPLL